MVSLKNKFCRLFSSTSLPYLLLGSASFLALSFAYYSQYVEGLVPCSLCHYQRYPYWIVFGLSLLGFFLFRHKKIITAFYLFISLSFATNMGISLYHFGIEKYWWSDHEICGASFAPEDSVDEMRQKIMEKPAPDCSQVQWSFLGLSMTGYNFIFSFLLLLFSGFGLFCQRRDT